MKMTGIVKPDHTRMRGFTLLEILIAMTILGISITVLVQLFSTNLRNITSSQQYLPAIIIAEARMSEILASDLLDENNKSFESDEGYKVDIVINETLRDRNRSLPVKLMEIDLTVRWTMDQKEKVFHLKSYKLVRRIIEEKTEEKKSEKK